MICFQCANVTLHSLQSACCFKMSVKASAPDQKNLSTRTAIGQSTVCVKGLQSQPNGLLCQVESCQKIPNWWRLTNGVRLSCCRQAEILACNSDGLVQAFLLGRLLQPQSQLSNQEMQDRWKKNSRSEWYTEMAPRSWQSQDMIPIDSSWHLGKFFVFWTYINTIEQAPNNSAKPQQE